MDLSLSETDVSGNVSENIELVYSEQEPIEKESTKNV